MKKKKNIIEWIKKHKIKTLVYTGGTITIAITCVGLLKLIKSPTCSCGAKMTIFDGWAWHTCPKCGEAVRIIDGHKDWKSDIFKEGTKEIYSDYQLADLCRGGGLTED